MSEIDIRNGDKVTVTAIRFADDEAEKTRTTQASVLRLEDGYNGALLTDQDYLDDSQVGFVIIHDKGHAKQLIQALEKAIELGWLK